jgi:hypothetical protein
MSKLSLLVLIVMMLFVWSVIISTSFSSIVLIISPNVLPFTVIAHSLATTQGVSISMYFSMSVALIMSESIHALM